MTRIKVTEIIHPQYQVAARCYHQARGETRPQAVRLYTASERRDGTGMQEYILTRHEKPGKGAMSSILKVHHIEHAPESRVIEMEEVATSGRMQEKKMILDWYASMGGMDCGSV